MFWKRFTMQTGGVISFAVDFIQYELDNSDSSTHWGDFGGGGGAAFVTTLTSQLQPSPNPPRSRSSPSRRRAGGDAATAIACTLTIFGDWHDN